MAAIYNEIEPFAAQWLRNLIAAGHIAPGDVDERSIEDVCPDDLRGYTQIHFFAGIGVWSAALRGVRWPDDWPIWSASCPCQGFSAAGKGLGFADERHLWPALYHLIDVCRPERVVGEQVASPLGLAWLDLVHADLEGAGYAVGAVDTCAAGFGAPHIRQRLYWVADASDDGQLRRRPSEAGDGRHPPRLEPQRLRDADGLGHPGRPGLPTREQETLVGAGRRQEGRAALQPGGSPDGLADADEAGRSPRGRSGRPHEAPAVEHGGVSVLGSGPVNGGWALADWILCRDGKWRPVEPGTFPLAHGLTNRVGRLRACGNAINKDQAEAFLACLP